jgi:hypothetical protein
MVVKIKEYKVYFIKNKINNKIYIGQTLQKISSRINRHFYDLKRNLHCNSYLQRSFNKYGEESFEYGLLEDGIFDINKSYEREEFYINEYKSLDELFGYNLILNNFKPLPNKVKNKISKSLNDNAKKDIKIVRYDLKSGDIIDFWDSSKKCEFVTGLRSANIVQHMNGNEKYTHVGGYGFIRYSEYLERGIIPNPDFRKRKNRLVPIKTILNGIENDFLSVIDAMSYHDIDIKDRKKISRVLSGERKSYKNIQFVYLKEESKQL